MTRPTRNSQTLAKTSRSKIGTEMRSFVSPRRTSRIGKVLIEINGCLNAVFINLLPEISVSIEQTHRNEIEIEVACGFAVIPGENAEAAGVIGNRFVKTEFGGEVGDRAFDRGTWPGFSVRLVASEILFEILENLFELAQKILVLCKLFKAGLPR